ncbi:MAG: putative sulfate/molybdate transporter [Gaiellaceae bacterium]
MSRRRGGAALGRELSGAVADLGVLVPIAVALIVTNGLSPTAVLLPAGLLYVVVSAVYRLPIAVQPLKAVGAIAIAQGLGSDEIAAAALLMGATFVVLGATGLIDVAGRAFPRALIRGVQLTVGLLFLKVSWGLVADPPAAFSESALDASWAIPLGAAVVLVAFLLRSRPIALALVAGGLVVMVLESGGVSTLGPSSVALPTLSSATFAAAFVALVIPQLPLTFANSCLAPADAARTYFREGARRVTPGRLATTLGSANLFSGVIAGMPVCHGAGGLTAHYAFGARTWRAPAAMGAGLLATAVLFGASLASLLTAFPLPILAGLLATAGLLHIGLLRDLRGIREWSIALLVGGIGFQWNLAVGLLVGLVVWWGPELLRRVGSAPWSSKSVLRSRRQGARP